MIIIAYDSIDCKSFVQKYTDKCIFLDIPNKALSSDEVIDIIERLMFYQKEVDVVFTRYTKELVCSLDTLNIAYTLLFPEFDDGTELYKMFNANTVSDRILINPNKKLDVELMDVFDWIDLKLVEIEIPPSNPQDIKDFEIEPELQEPKLVTQVNMLQAKPELTLENVIKEDIEITEADVRSLKSVTNKFRVILLLQAKSRLNTVLKLCNTLDKLYDELTNRIDASITTSDTASLMYTTDYIAKALDETNKFMMTLITNEKLQNFFIIDNSSIINIGNDAIDIDKRERLRKATEIVLNNVDYITEGNYNELKDPNKLDKEETNANI